jgi:hypothetical protein
MALVKNWKRGKRAALRCDFSEESGATKHPREAV